MLEIHLETTNLDDLDVRMRRAISQKMTQLTNLLYDKVIENLSGKILQKRSGQLIESVQKRRERMSEGVIEASVFVDPVTPKAWALERGGERDYLILPTKAQVLRFYWDKVGQTVFFTQVNHPPSRAFGYLRTALEEVAPEVPERFSDLIAMVISGEGEE